MPEVTLSQFASVVGIPVERLQEQIVESGLPDKSVDEMITDEEKYEKGQILFNIDEEAGECYLLLEGAVDLHYIIVDEQEPQLRKEFVVGTINPGEVLGISSVIEPYIYTATAIVINDRVKERLERAALGLTFIPPEEWVG